MQRVYNNYLDNFELDEQSNRIMLIIKTVYITSLVILAISLIGTDDNVPKSITQSIDYNAQSSIIGTGTD